MWDVQCIGSIDKINSMAIDTTYKMATVILKALNHPTQIITDFMM